MHFQTQFLLEIMNVHIQRYSDDLQCVTAGEVFDHALSLWSAAVRTAVTLWHS